MELILSGRLDTNNAKSVQDSLEEKISLVKDLSNEVLEFDLSDLGYISSAGLRVFLHFKKKVKEICVKNVQPQVYDIFEVTGFTELLNIEKKYRELDISGCQKLGEGANGIVYILDPETIIKVYKNPVIEDIKKERFLARTAFSHGIPTAISYDIVKVGNGFGTVFEFLNATSLTKLILKNPNDLPKYVHDYTELLKTVHSTEMSGVELPKAKDVFLSKIRRCKDRLDETFYNKVIDYINSIEDKNILLHGDFHTNNILVQNNELLLIDMDTLCFGDVSFEFAGVFLSYVGFGEINSEETLSFFGFDTDFSLKFYNSVLLEYFGDELKKYELKISLLGYIRLLSIYCYGRYSEDEEKKNIIKKIISKIEDLLSRV